MPSGKLVIKLQPHALDRWKEYMGWNKYCNIRQVIGDVRRHLGTALKNGMNVDSTGAAHLQIRSDLWAVIVPELTGGWAVITFHRGEKMAARAERDKKNAEAQMALIWGLVTEGDASP